MSEDGLVFEQLDETTLEIRDTISNQQYRIESDGPMTVEPSDYDDFPAPVMKSVIVDAEEVHILGETSPTVRKTDGSMVTQLLPGETEYSTDTDCTVLELHNSVKTYLRIDGPFEYKSLDKKGILSLSGSTQFILGARGWWCYPNNTITVTEKVEDLREAISHFGDAMLTASPERSFTTLRGHPPRLQIGDSFNIPDSLSKPDTGITITVPSTTSALLTVAPLAYYLLATVETGDRFTVRTENGFVYRPEYETLSDAVYNVLTHCFYLDCIVRTEGLYQIELQERYVFENYADTDLDFAELYPASLAKRTERYLQIESNAVEEITSEWPMTAVVEPDTTAILGLPYLVYELARIQPDTPQRYTGEQAKRQVVKTFSNDAEESRSTTLVFNNEASFVRVPETDSRQTVWVGEGIPLNATKYLVEGYEHDTFTTGRDAKANQENSSGIDVTVVCNDRKMSKELTAIRDTLTPREDYPVEVSVYSQLSTNQLSKILAKRTDYLHFIGHATPDGLECTDGILNVKNIEQNNTTAFFLNACQSYQQGKYLVEQGSSGGVVTCSDISNKYALESSGYIAKLLDVGFGIGGCLDVVKEMVPLGEQYTVVGNHKTKVAQPTEIPPQIRRISQNGQLYDFELVTPAMGNPTYAVGGLVQDDISTVDRYRVIPAATSGTVDWDDLKEYLLMHDIPVAYEGELLSRDEFIESIERQRSTNGDT